MKIHSSRLQALLHADAQRARSDAVAEKVRRRAHRFHLIALSDQVRRLPDERDLVVHKLRTEIKAGNYHISSGRIVDALLVRLRSTRATP
ncbi:MAG: flagellar biosynthesis anti-sigma factor FlgM [Candidatus Eremiobacteraeota bacterium]|nr:flagellar biosynthesis anti-sigma factor FlgM [Candidatus Eremiobacteraeota bacterium]